MSDSIGPRVTAPSCEIHDSGACVGEACRRRSAQIRRPRLLDGLILDAELAQEMFGTISLWEILSPLWTS
jgi:hypothetical protein